MYYKFLNEDGSSHHDPDFYYPFPTATEPGAWAEAPGPRPTDTAPCGPGRLHLCNQPIPLGGARWGVPYEAEGEEEIGHDKYKTAFRHVRLLRHMLVEEIIYSGANLTHANLIGANLTDADLTHADLFDADLFDADLTRANLRNANLRNANLTHANLIGANLIGANLIGAN